MRMKKIGTSDWFGIVKANGLSFFVTGNSYKMVQDSLFVILEKGGI